MANVKQAVCVAIKVGASISDQSIRVDYFHIVTTVLGMLSEKFDANRWSWIVGDSVANATVWPTTEHFTRWLNEGRSNQFTASFNRINNHMVTGRCVQFLVGFDHYQSWLRRKVRDRRKQKANDETKKKSAIQATNLENSQRRILRFLHRSNLHFQRHRDSWQLRTIGSRFWKFVLNFDWWQKAGHRRLQFVHSTWPNVPFVGGPFQTLEKWQLFATASLDLKRPTTRVKRKRKKNKKKKKAKLKYKNKKKWNTEIW